MRTAEADGFGVVSPDRRECSRITLEICVGSVEHAVAAERAGADRIELCAELTVGGTTPSVALMEAARDAVSIPIHVMIRPRGGNFVYSAEEFATMRKDLRAAQRCGMDGAVLGILDAGGRVDVPRTRELVQLARLPVTFHRAFDEVGDFSSALEAVIATGARRILTSGGAARAVEGLEVLEQLMKQAGQRIAILPGAGINAENVAQIVQATAAREVHASLGLSSPAGEGFDGDACADWEEQVRRLRAAVDGIEQ